MRHSDETPDDHAEQPEEPSTREAIAAFLRDAGYDPALVERTMDELADAIIAKTKAERLERWLDSVVDEPLTPEEVDRVMASIKHQEEG